MAKTRLNGEGSIRLRKDGRYEVRASGGIDFRTGEPIRISRYAKTEEEAIRILHQIGYAKGNNKLNVRSFTLGEWLDFWLEVYMKHCIKQSTYASYETYAKRHFKPSLGNVELMNLTPQLLQQFYNYKIETEHLSPKTISNMNMYLHKALEQAVKENLIYGNPASAINLPRAKRPEIEILTRDEQAALVRASYSHRYGVFIRLVLVTGLRLGELLGLMWEDINFRRGVLNVKRTLNRLQITGLPDDYEGPKTEMVFQEPKTDNSIRSIPLLPGVIQDLLRWKDIQNEDRINAENLYVESNLVVTNPYGGFIEPRTFSDYYHQILQIAGVKHFTFHALRHTFASRAMEQGMDSKTLSVLLGHYSVAFTMDTYTHVLDDHKWEGIKLMEELYSIDKSIPVNQLYPLIFTPTDTSGYTVSAPDFPSVRFNAETMEEGIERAGIIIKNEILSLVYPPVPTELCSIPTVAGQIALQITV